MQTKSIFSYNTNQTGFKTHSNPNSRMIQQNNLHDFYYKILPTFSKQYPYLCKIFYLQLILRQNILIFTTDRIDARDIWLAISKMLDLKKPQIYIIDDKIKIQQFLNTKNEYGRVLLYEVSKLTADMVNKILNNQGHISILGVQSSNQIINAHISDIFSMILVYQDVHQLPNLINTYNHDNKNQNTLKFDKKAFNQCVKLNFEVVMQQNQQQGFLKPFLQLFQYKLQKYQMKISQSKWKKMLKILKFIGVNKTQGVFKKLTLGDFIISPLFLASSVLELKKLTEIIQQILIQFIPYYGIQKFEKSTKNHFWYSNTHFQLINKILQKINKNSISFFYPCIKYPQTASLKLSAQYSQLYYQINGYQKKLMSDHHYEIQQNKPYKFQLQLNSNSKMITHVGVACYDKLKNIILPIQACRKKNSQVIYQKLQGNKLYVSNTQNLKNWANNQDNFAYQRGIGIYINGQYQQLPPVANILYNSKQAYSKTDRPYKYIYTSQVQQKDQNNGKQSYIQLSQDTLHWFINFRHLLEKNKTVFMNHYEGGTGCIGETIMLDGNDNWKNVKVQYQRAINNIQNVKGFYLGTKYIRAVLMVNYNQGYPNFQINNKKGIFMFKNITFGVNE